MKRYVRSTTVEYIPKWKPMDEISSYDDKARKTIMRTLMTCIDWAKFDALQEADMVIDIDDAIRILRLN